MAITDNKIKQSKPKDKPYKIFDGNGLYLEVRPSGAKHWRYKYRIDGKENLFAIGPYPEVTLMEARKIRQDSRELVKRGIHPSHARSQALISQIDENNNTFLFVANELLLKKEKSWSEAYRRSVSNMLKKHVFPKIGNIPMRSITPHAILAIIQNVASTAPSVAINCKLIIGAVFRYAVLTLRADNDPTSILVGIIEKPDVKHAEAIPPEHIGYCLNKLETYGGRRVTSLAIQLMIYTFVRTIEVRRCQRSDIDLEARLWIIPENKMKKRRKHIVPLSDQVIEILKEAIKISGDSVYLFPNSRRPDDMISNTTFNRAFQYIGFENTGHDFRATASTYFYENGWDSNHIEMQLAHAERNQTRAAYNHAEYLPQRTKMMLHWADYLDQLKEEYK